MDSSSNVPTVAPGQSASSLLVAEILGFSPQLVLDDIINIANNAVQDGVNGMEEFLEKWADERAERKGGDWDSTQEVEQGLVSFQTLLEYHTDLAFDFFEAWSLRNIFAIPPDLPVVAPHQQGLDLTQTPEREQELMDEMEELRKKINAQRRLKRLYTRSAHVAKVQRTRATKRLERYEFLKSPSLDTLGALPNKLAMLHESISALPPLDPATIASLSQVPLTDPGKRTWETNKTGYLNWAVGQLLEKKAGVGGGMSGHSDVDVLVREVEQVGDADQLRSVVEAVESVNTDLNTLDEPRAGEKGK